jgi:hypothetical protein
MENIRNTVFHQLMIPSSANNQRFCFQPIRKEILFFDWLNQIVKLEL